MNVCNMINNHKTKSTKIKKKKLKATPQRQEVLNYLSLSKIDK